MLYFLFPWPQATDEVKLVSLWQDAPEEVEDPAQKDKVNLKKNQMNVATAMATLGMANTRGLEDPTVGPMMLSSA